VAVVPVVGSRHHPEVAAEVAPSPAQALVKEAAPVELKSGFDEGLGVKLQCNLPALNKRPAGEVLVVVVVGGV